MSYALNRIPSTAARAGYRPFVRPPATRSWIASSDAVAAASKVLDRVLDDCGVTQEAMRSGSRVTILRDDRFDAAVRLYRDGEWELAFERLAALADQDHGPAARLALLMMRYGEPLYGVAFPARPTQVARWAQRVLRASSRATASPSSMTARA